MLRPLPSFLASLLNPKVEDSEEQISTYDSEALQHTQTTELSEHYWANDGVVPIFSQWHPHECSSTKCIHYDSLPPPSTPLPQQEQIDFPKRIEPGIWNVYTLENAHHLSLLPLWSGSPLQVDFWTNLGRYLTDLDAERMYFDI